MKIKIKMALFHLLIKLNKEKEVWIIEWLKIQFAKKKNQTKKQR